MAHRLTHAEQLTRSEHVAALATLRPVLDELIHRACRQQLAAVALMPRLSALRTPRAILSPRKPPLARRIRARRQRGVTRTLSQLPLQLLHPRLQLLDTQVHRQQNLDYSLTPRVINRLRLRALHTPRFDEAELCPPTPLNAYKKPRISGGFISGRPDSNRGPHRPERCALPGCATPRCPCAVS